MNRIINNVSANKRNENVRTVIKTDRLTENIGLMNEERNVNKEDVADCITTIEAAISVQKDRIGKYNQGVCISLRDAFRASEASGIEKKDPTKTENGATSRTSIFTARETPHYQPNFKFEHPPYARRFNRYRNERYREAGTEMNDQQQSTRKTAENDLRPKTSRKTGQLRNRRTTNKRGLKSKTTTITQKDSRIFANGFGIANRRPEPHTRRR